MDDMQSPTQLPPPRVSWNKGKLRRSKAPTTAQTGLVDTHQGHTTKPKATLVPNSNCMVTTPPAATAR
jgi:hypothetical protein